MHSEKFMVYDELPAYVTGMEERIVHTWNCGEELLGK
jgi:hypothetical protein